MRDDQFEESEWVAAWEQMQHKRLVAWKQDVITQLLDAPVRSSIICGITLTTNPPRFVDRVPRATSLCPACGEVTGTDDRIAVSLYPTMNLRENSQLTVGIGCWMHSKCFVSCPDSDAPVPIPW